MNVNILNQNMLLSPLMRTDLADYVRGVMDEKGLTEQDIENRSHHGITRGYVSQILSRTSTNLTTKKLKALSTGLGVPFLHVLQAVAGKDPSTDAAFRESVLYYTYEKIKTASKEDREFFDGVIKMLLDRLDRTGSDR